MFSTIANSETAHSPLFTLTGVQILGTGSFAPEIVVTNQELSRHGYDPDWIVQRTGIHERRRVAPGQATSDIAYESAVRCIEQAGVSANDIDLIVFATLTPDTPMPSTACHLQKRLGNKTAPAMDINAACAGFMYALVTGMQFVKNGCSRLALVVGADVMSMTVNPHDKKTFPLFGDGAGAVLIGPGDADQGLLAYTLGADGSGSDLICMPAGGSRQPLTAAVLAANKNYVHMDGRAVFKWAVRLVTESILDTLRHARLTPADIDLVLLHQANLRIIDAAVADLGVPREKIVTNLDRFGNTSAGSIPLVLDEAFRQGRIKRGDKLVMCGFGAGLVWGSAVVQW